MKLAMYEIKNVDEPWNNKTRTRLNAIGPASSNLDGHNMEYLRKLCDKRRETDKIIMYYSDGAMPMENYAEEKEILLRELATCKKNNYVVAGVGVRTDSPKQYGLPTVQINKPDEVRLVVKHLEKLLLK